MEAAGVADEAMPGVEDHNGEMKERIRDEILQSIARGLRNC